VLLTCAVTTLACAVPMVLVNRGSIDSFAHAAWYVLPTALAGTAVAILVGRRWPQPRENATVVATRPGSG
jgi:hypothetical protein